MGNAASEMQHLANQLQGLGTDEKKFLQLVYEGKANEAAALLKAKPSVMFARTKEWYNAWHIAAQSGNLELLEVLLNYRRSSLRPPLPGEPLPHDMKTKKGDTPLMVACHTGNLTTMLFLISVGAEITEPDSFGNTIFHYAALRGQVKILEIMLAKAEAEQASYGSVKVRYVDLRNEAGLLPLHFAVWGGSREAAEVLLNYQADLAGKSTHDSVEQVTCDGGSTPLHIAALKNDPIMVAFLLDFFVKLANEGYARHDPRNVKDNYGHTAYDIAHNANRHEVIELLDPKTKLMDVPEAVWLAPSPSFRRSGSIRVSREDSQSGAAPGLAISPSFRRSSSIRAPGRPSREDSLPGVASGASSLTCSPAPIEELCDGFAALAAAPVYRKVSEGGFDGSPSPPAAPVPVLAPPPRSLSLMRQKSGSTAAAAAAAIREVDGL